MTFLKNTFKRGNNMRVSERIQKLREIMTKENIDYYIVQVKIFTKVNMWLNVLSLENI